MTNNEDKKSGYYKRDNVAKSIIVQNITNDIIPYVYQLNTSKKLWDVFKVLFDKEEVFDVDIE